VRDRVADRRCDRADPGQRQEGRQERKQEERLREADAGERQRGAADQSRRQQVASQRRDGVEHADEERHGVGRTIVVAGVLLPEVGRERLALLHVGRVLRRTDELVDLLHRLLGDRRRSAEIAPQRCAVRHPGGYAAQREHRRKAPDRVGAAAEAEQVDAVAGFVNPHDPGVAVDDVGGDAETRRLAGDVV
jgi:hypothetical protein